MTYLYDGSFEGFLTLVYQSYHLKKSASKIIKDPCDIDLFDRTDELFSVITNRTYATGVLDSLQKRFQKRHFNRIFHIFFCDGRDFERPLYDFIVLGFKDLKNLENITHPSILYIQRLEKEYFSYLHKMYGFIRFRELADKTLYAMLEGKFNILPFLGAHFSKRLDGYDFILHDTGRSLAFVKNKNNSAIHDVADFRLPVYSSDEEKFQKLWKCFFEHITVEERKNPKLQRSWVPLLYRKYMTEFQD